MKYLILAAALLAAPLTATAQSYSYGPIEVNDAWVRQPVKSDSAAAYMSVTNHGNRPVTLTSITSPAAVHAELHSMHNDNGRMMMRPQPNFVIAPGQTAAFAPGGTHVMLHDLPRKPELGEGVPLTLTFAELQPAQVVAMVKDPLGNRNSTRIDHYSPKQIGFNRDRGAHKRVQHQ